MPEQGSCKVFYLYDDSHRSQMREHMHREIERVDREMAEVQMDLECVSAAAEDMDQVLVLLDQMKELARQATICGEKERQRLNQQLQSLKARLDAIAWNQCARWSARDAARIRKMVAAIETLRL